MKPSPPSSFDAKAWALLIPLETSTFNPLDHPERPFWVGNGSLSSIARPTDLNVVALADDYNNSVQVDKLNLGQNFEADYFPKKKFIQGKGDL